MLKKVVVVSALLLAACGSDGPPGDTPEAARKRFDAASLATTESQIPGRPTVSPSVYGSASVVTTRGEAGADYSVLAGDALAGIVFLTRKGPVGGEWLLNLGPANAVGVQLRYVGSLRPTATDQWTEVLRPFSFNGGSEDGVRRFAEWCSKGGTKYLRDACMAGMEKRLERLRP